MTREEKAEVVSDFCDSFFKTNKGGCFGCPLAKDVDECTDHNYVENYDILVKAGLIAPDDEIETENEEVKTTTIKNAADGDFCTVVMHPEHYTKGGIECINAIKASMTADGFMDYCKGNIIKYLWRWRDKGGRQDLEKAVVYLGWLIEAAKGEK